MEKGNVSKGQQPDQRVENYRKSSLGLNIATKSRIRRRASAGLLKINTSSAKMDATLNSETYK